MDAVLGWRDDAMLAEAPVWDAAAGVVRWVDTPAGLVHGWHPVSGRHDVLPALGTSVGCIAPAGEGRLVAARRHDVVTLATADGRMAPLARPLDPGGALIFNDGKCGPDGAFWIGAMTEALTPGSGVLIRVAADGAVTRLREGMTLPNGIAWTADGARVYVIDSLERTVTAYPMPFDAAAGEVVIEVPEALGLPDGMAIDAQGQLWIAHWGGGAVRRWDPATGAVTQTVALPVSQPSSCCFGGPDMRTLFITSAWEGMDEAARAREPLAGSLFVADVAVPGLPVSDFR
jgi:sugar lactone lactonase YvrE